MNADFIEITLACLIGSQVVLIWLFAKNQIERHKERKILCALIDDYLKRNVPDTYAQIKICGLPSLESARAMAEKEIQNKKSC